MLQAYGFPDPSKQVNTVCESQETWSNHGRGQEEPVRDVPQSSGEDEGPEALWEKPASPGERQGLRILPSQAA